MASGDTKGLPAPRSWWAIGSAASAALFFTGLLIVAGPLAVGLGWRALRGGDALSRTSRRLATVGVVAGILETIFLAIFITGFLLLYFGVVRVH